MTKTKKWLLLFLAVVILCAFLCCLYNVFVDPFGVFGDVVFNDYSDNMTTNPRVAKIAYLDKNYQKYDSYVIGSSKALCLLPDELNKYTGNSYYGLTYFGIYLPEVKNTVEYIIENYEVENIILALEPTVGNYVKTDFNDANRRTHSKVSGERTFEFYLWHLFANPKYGFAKINTLLYGGFALNYSDRFNPETGCLVKYRKRAVTPISDFESYYEYNKFSNFIFSSSLHIELKNIEEAVDCLSEIKTACDAAGINVTFLWCPISDEELALYDKNEVIELVNRVAEISDSWNFMGYTSVNCDNRYFYDAGHCREAVGEMMLARMYGNSDIYAPEGFGELLTKENVVEKISAALNGIPGSEDDYVTQIPILTYHSLSEDMNNEQNNPFANYLIGTTPVSVERFEEHLKVLSDEGFTSITCQDLINYVDYGYKLPEKPILITFDGGFQNNLTLAAPLLKKYGFSATISIVGALAGQSTYKDTGIEIEPHFSLEDAKPWIDAGVIEIASNSYDLWQPYTTFNANTRFGVLTNEGESENSYISLLRADFSNAKQHIESALGSQVNAYAYPYGAFNEISETFAHMEGYRVTLTYNSGINEVLKGNPQCLHQLRRNVVTDEMSGSDVVNSIIAYTH